MGLEGATRPPAYLSPQWCTALSLWLALPTLGYSLIFVTLRLELEEVSRRDITCQNSGSATAGRPIPPLGSEPFPAL
jgi:hypothetical protein